MLISDTKITAEQMLLASITDRLGLMLWINSKDGSKGRNRPKSILNEMLKQKESKDKDIKSFTSGDEFSEAWRKLTERGSG